MNLIAFFVQNPVKVSVGVLLAALFGSIALVGMPVQLSPEVESPVLTVATRWPGASPREVEREIVQEQEEQLKSVEGMTKLSSESLDSRGNIRLEFSVGTDMREALIKVNAQLQQVREYPEDADEPVIRTTDASDRAVAWFVLLPRRPGPEQFDTFMAEHPELAPVLTPVRDFESPAIVLRRLNELAAAHPAVKQLQPPPVEITHLRKFVEDFIEARFERVPGVANSNVFGGQEEELQVIVDPQRLAARQLTISDVRRALRDRDRDISGGDLWDGKRRYIVRTVGQYRSPEEVAGTILARRDGSPVYVRDVAQVKLGYKKPTGLVRRFGIPCIAVNCQRETGANVLEVMQGLRAASAALNAGELKQRGLQLEQVYDETEYITSAIGLVQKNIVVGGTLTLIVLLVYLRTVRSTLVIALAIPTSIIGSFLLLALMGRSLNVISLAGMAFAVGMLVDNAVVVLENIYRHYQRGADPFTAAVDGAKEVWGAVIASTLTTLAVFIPVLFVQEEAGQLFRDIALAISSAVGLSLLVSVIVIPTATARVLRRRASETEELGHDAVPGPQQASAAGLTAFGTWFVALVVAVNVWLGRSVLLRLATVIVFVGAAIQLSVMMMPKVEYLPHGNRNLVFAIMMPPPGYNLNQMAEIGEDLEESLRPYWEMNRPPGQSEGPVIRDFFYVARGSSLFMGARSADPLKAGELIDPMLQAAFQVPGMFGIVKQSSLFERGLDAGRTIDVEVTGPDIGHLIKLGVQILTQVNQIIPKVQALPRPSLDQSSPELHVVPKWEQAADLQLTVADLGYAMNALVDGAYATDYFKGGTRLDLSIHGQAEYSHQTQDLESVSLAVPGGQVVPLSAVAEVHLRSGPEQINHRERQRAITIVVTPPPEVALEDAMQRISEQIIAPLQQQGQLDGGYQLNLSGTADKLRETWQALRFNLILAVVITYLLMAALFESWLYPIAIMVSVPLAGVGGLAGLRVLNLFQLQQLDVLTMLGFIILIGTVVNNAILIVHQTLNLMRHEDLPHHQALAESIRTRVRPIFMTTTTTVFGLLPLVLYPGAGSELYRGLGSVVLGGLIVSTAFTLVLVPTLFSLLLEGKMLLRRRLNRSSTSE